MSAAALSSDAFVLAGKLGSTQLYRVIYMAYGISKNYAITDAENPEEAVLLEVKLPYGVDLAGKSLKSNANMRPNAGYDTGYMQWRVRMATNEGKYVGYDPSAAAPTDFTTNSIKSADVTYTAESAGLTRSDNQTLYFTVSPESVADSEYTLTKTYALLDFDLTVE